MLHRRRLFAFAALMATALSWACSFNGSDVAAVTGLEIREGRAPGGGTPGPVTLPSLSSRGSSRANGISPDGDLIVGTSTDANGASRPVKWSLQSGSWVISVLPFDASWSGTYPVAANSAGLIVGRRYNGSKWEGVAWLTDGGVTYFDGYASDVNTSGVISGDLSGKPGAWIPTSGSSWQRIDFVLPSSVNGVAPTGGMATGINDSNVIVGFSSVGRGERAIRWNYSGGQWTQGVVLHGGVSSWMGKIGNSGLIGGGIWVTMGASSCDRRSGALWSDPNAEPVLVSVPGDNNAIWIFEDVNSSGDLVGHTRPICSGGGKPAWRSSAGATQWLTLPKGATSGFAMSVSDRITSAKAVGYAGANAILWTLP